MKNQSKDETLTLSAAITMSNDRRKAKDIKKSGAAPSSDGEKTAYAVGRRLKAAWTAFKTPPAKPARS